MSDISIRNKMREMNETIEKLEAENKRLRAALVEAQKWFNGVDMTPTELDAFQDSIMKQIDAALAAE